MFEISHTSNLFIRKKSDVVEFFIWGKDFFLGGKGSFMGGDIEVFFRGGKVLERKVQSPESRVQSPESRVQGPVQLLGYVVYLRSPVIKKGLLCFPWQPCILPLNLKFIYIQQINV